VNEDDLKDFSKLIAGIFGMNQRDASDDVIEIYYRALADYSLDDLKKAFSEHVRNPDCGTFLPKPADIIRILEGDSNKKSLEAWVKAYKAISRAGSGSTVIFDDPIIHAVISVLGGWERFCLEVTDKTEKFIKKEFIDFYKMYLSKDNFDYPKCLIGRNERINHEKGFSCGKHDIQYIGNSRKEDLIMLETRII